MDSCKIRARRDRLLRFGYYTTIPLTSAQGQRKVCYLERSWTDVERYMIIKNKVLNTFQYNSYQSAILTPLSRHIEICHIEWRILSILAFLLFTCRK